MKRCTGETKIESFKKISDRLDKAADEIDRDADKLDRAIKSVPPQTDKLQKDFTRFFDQMARASNYGSNTADAMKGAASELRNLTKTYTSELRDATETASALQDMYSTLAKAIDKANKSNSSGDKMKAEIAGKAYEKASKAAEKKLLYLGLTTRKAQKGHEQAAQYVKQSYLNSAEAMDRILNRIKNYLGKDAKEVDTVKAEFEKAKQQMSWVKDLSK
ncbi:hypothetical protein QO034_16835 [Sedimentitalea sp. JM2-8]|uniref:Uncharacterized protein n=2 Tax=Sedimentitalea xiamensis TaxID=3050037 RepID=A0ABT7FI40_9RHOB|nr:hypothetical protein [Sedimentitalea xiamensis]